MKRVQVAVAAFLVVFLAVPPFAVSQRAPKRAIQVFGAESRTHIERAQAEDRDLRDTIQFLYSKGYKPTDVQTTIYSDDIGSPEDDVEVSFWAWEDGDAATGTGIYIAREKHGRGAEISAIQMDKSGKLNWKLTTYRRSSGVKKQVFQQPPQPAARTVSLQIQDSPEYFDSFGFYHCAVVGCSIAAVVSFLFLNPAAFAGGCTGTMLKCAWDSFNP